MKTLLLILLFSTPQANAARIESISTYLNHSVDGHSRKIIRSDLPLEIADEGKISTGAGGQARVILKDGTRIDLGSFSSIDLASAGSNEGRNVPALLFGKIRALVQKQTSNKTWQMKVGNTSMGVRGTEFIIEKESPSANQFLLCTTEGTVALDTAKEKELLVHAGEGVVVHDDGSADEPLSMDRTQMDWWKSRSEPDSVENWRWDGSPAVTSLDSSALYAGQLKWIPDFGIWGRALYSKNEAELRDDLTGRLKIGATLVASRSLLFYSDIRLLAKTGFNNPEPGLFNFHQGFAHIRFSDASSLAIGRQEWDFGSGLIIGKDPWKPVTRTNDGALYVLRTHHARLNFFSTSLRDRLDSTKLEDWISGIHTDFSRVPVDAYGIWMKRNGAREFDTLNLGGHGIYRFGDGFSWEKEISTQLRIEPDENHFGYLGNMVFGYDNEKSALPHTFKIKYLNAHHYEPLLPDSHRFLGLVNAIPRLSLVKKYSLYSEIRPEIFHSKYSLSAEGIIFGNKLGHETDFMLGSRPLENLTARYGYGYFHSPTSKQTLIFVMLDWAL